jgi:hypothetical protein
MKAISYYILLLLLLLQSLNCYSQNWNQEKDSIYITRIANDFFNWYISNAKGKNFVEFNPIEIKDSYGMTTLDFSKYFQNLIHLSFSDSLIIKEKLSYSECLKNLAKVKYSDFLKLKDLDDFERLNCDFNNYYRWTGGQEMFDGYYIKKVRFHKEKAFVIGFLYFHDPKNIEIRNFVREIVVTFILQKDEWKILNIEY